MIKSRENVRIMKIRISLIEKISPHLMLTMIMMFSTGHANAITVTLGDQDFSDGDVINDPRTYNSAQIAEPAPFDSFKGSDFSGPDFSESWTFNYAADPYVVAATIEIGLYDYDCFSVNCNVVSSFTIEGFDFTSALNSLISPDVTESRLYNTFLVDISSISQALSDGTAIASLTLQSDPVAGFDTNGAGLDFSTLTLATAPVPVPAAVWLFGSGLIGLIGIARRKIS